MAQTSQPSFNRKPGRTQNRGRTTVKPLPVESTDEDGGESSDCPEPNGFFADAEQCDKYYACNEGVITEKLCPDGMVFNDYSIDQEKCDLPYNIDCSKRPALREYYFRRENSQLNVPFMYMLYMYFRNAHSIATLSPTKWIFWS